MRVHVSCLNVDYVGHNYLRGLVFDSVDLGLFWTRFVSQDPRVIEPFDGNAFTVTLA